MIDVVSSGGIGNKIKNLVSALRLADIKNDIVNFPYYDGIIDYYTPPPTTLIQIPLSILHGNLKRIKQI